MDLDEALELCEEIITMIDEDRDLEEAQERNDRCMAFCESVREKVSDMSETIEDRGRVTEGQATALENMKAGLDRWIH
jgi:hypothetical protein